MSRTARHGKARHGTARHVAGVRLRMTFGHWRQRSSRRPRQRFEDAQRPPTRQPVGGRSPAHRNFVTVLSADPRRGVLTRSTAARAGLIDRSERHFEETIVLTLRRALHFLAHTERAAGISLDRAERNRLTRVRRRGAGKLHRSIGRKVRAGDGDHGTGSLPLNGDADLQRWRCLCTYGHRQRDKAQPEQDGGPDG